MADLISIADTCRTLGLSRTTINKLINEGALQRVKSGRRALVTQRSVDGYVQHLIAQTENPTPKDPK